MLTFFCIPKAFQGHFGVIQRNALASWRALGPSCEVLVFGDEEGAGAAAEAAGARHLPAIGRNEFGTPLLDDVFRQARAIAQNDTLCYVNSDIIFLADLLAALTAVSARFARYLIVGRRWNLDLEEPISFQDSQAWRLSFRAFIEGRGSLYDGFNLDYFIFPRPLFENMPSFAVGRPAWDNWMVYEARRRQIPVIDATDAILAVHQNHDYSHTSEGRIGGKPALWRGVEAQRNRDLSGSHYFGIEDATHVMNRTCRITRRFDPTHCFRRLPEAAEIYPAWRWFLGPLRAGVQLIQKTDHRVRLFLLRRGIDLFPHREKRTAGRMP